jgi:hypothetical protein
MFLLREESGRLRLYVDDVAEGFTPVVCAGKHTSIDPRAAGNPGRAIAWVLLTPGEDFDEHVFGLRLGSYAFAAMGASRDKEYVLSLLDALRDSTDERIRRDARGIPAVIESDFGSRRWTDLSAPCPVAVR